MKRLWHVPTLLASFVASLIGLKSLNLFMGPDTGDAIGLILVGLLGMHFLAFLIGLFLPPRMVSNHLALVATAILPIGLLAAASIKESRYLKNEAVFDRFRDSLHNPIPESVRELKFIDYEESKDTHLSFRFRINPADLDRIIEHRGFQQITPDQFRNPTDHFRDMAYLPMDGPVTFYTIEENKGGYPEPGWGEGYTLKVNGTRDAVIFRRESAMFYRNRSWESRND